MTGTLNPFIMVDKQAVIGTLKAAGSRDPDVLHAQKMTLLSHVRFPRLAGVVVVVTGGLLVLTRVGVLVGIPLIAGGWWLYRRGTRNVEAVETGYAEFLGSGSPK